MGNLRDAIDELDLEDWLQDYADVKYVHEGEIKLEECPECGNSKYKLYVNTDDKIWNCFVCGWGKGLNDITVFMSKISGRTLTDIRIELIQAVIPTPGEEFVQYISGLISGSDEDGNSNKEESVCPPGNRGNGHISNRVRKYAYSRGIGDEYIEEFDLRFALSVKSGTKETEMRGPFLVFPVYYGEKIVSWQGRRIVNKDPKYVSYANIHDWMWPLYGQNMDNICSQQKVVLVEGVVDALALYDMGIPSLCTFGKSINSKQEVKLRELGVEHVVFAWDLDAAKEIRKAVRSIKSSFGTISVAKLQGGPVISGKSADPGDALIYDIEDWLRECVETAIDVDSANYLKWEIENS